MPEHFLGGFARCVGEGEANRELTHWQARDHMMEHAEAARLHVDMVVTEQGQFLEMPPHVSFSDFVRRAKGR